MKNAGVCNGCKYHITRTTYHDLKGGCNYMNVTGHSRLVVEEKNGGYKDDSCICYEVKTRRRRKNDSRTG